MFTFFIEKYTKTLFNSKIFDFSNCSLLILFGEALFSHLNSLDMVFFSYLHLRIYINIYKY